MARSIEQVIAGLPAEHRAKVEARARRLIQDELASQLEDGQIWPPMPRAPPTDECYVIDRGTMENLHRVMMALYNSGEKRLTGDQIRDLAIIMDANLAKAEGTQQQLLPIEKR